MNRRALLVAGPGVLFGSTQKAWAHHSTAMYDMANPVTVKGTVKRFQWTYRVDEFFCENNRDHKPLFGAK